MVSMVTVACSGCGSEFARTLKQVNQALKKNGFWRCVECARVARRVDLVGQRFGRLTVKGYSHSMRTSERDTVGVWNCICDCGSAVQARTQFLNGGVTRSCGCLKLEVVAERARTHGLSSTREYRIWCAMKARCYNVNTTAYSHYGKRGIRVCERWGSFENFFSDMGKCPDGHSIERLNVDGDYSPENCVWADRMTQARNTRRNRNFTYRGTTACLKDWAASLGIDQASLRGRLTRWTVEKSLTTPKKGTV